MKRQAIILAALCGLCHASARQMEFLTVEDGVVRPAAAVATIDQLTSNLVAAVAAEAAATAASNAAAEVAALVDGVAEVVNGLEGVGYIRGYMLDFSVAGIEANTNVTASIVKFTPNASNDANYAYCDLFTYFSEEPASWPVARVSTSPRADATWTELESVSVELTEVTVGETTYECYRNRVAIPTAQTNAFFRVFADTAQNEVGAYLPVQNGIMVGGRAPLTWEGTFGTNVVKFVGGIRVQ